MITYKEILAYVSGLNGSKEFNSVEGIEKQRENAKPGESFNIFWFEETEDVENCRIDFNMKKQKFDNKIDMNPIFDENLGNNYIVFGKIKNN